MKRLGVIANCGKPHAPAVLKRLVEKAGELGIELVADPPTARLLKRAGKKRSGGRLGTVDALMALGGDGTMLRTVRLRAGRDIPVIGVNLGSLGFLTSVAEDELDRALECLASGNYTTSVRAMAEAVVERKGRKAVRYRALNDVVVSSGPSNRVVVLGLAINGEKVTSYVCDGLIVSTPTGSTGHSLSAGGPILAPATPAFVVSLICPHSLSSRPLVVPDRSEMAVTVERASGRILLSVDGQIGESLAAGDRVRIRRSGKGVRFIHLPGHSYFAVLRQKLHWSGSTV